MKYVINEDGILMARHHKECILADHLRYVDVEPPVEDGIKRWNGEAWEIVPVSPPDTNAILEKIKLKRNKLLIESDWTQLEDFPHSAAKKKEWKTYRQALRDFPETYDPANPIWPVAP